MEILALLMTSVSAFLGAGVASWFALHRFRKEKLWERKADAYIRILEALHHSRKFSEVHIDASLRNKEVPKEEDEDLRRIAKKNNEEIWRVADVGKLFLSPKAIDRLRRYRSEYYHETSRAESWVDYLEIEHELIKEAIEELVIIAREDLEAGGFFDGFTIALKRPSLQ